jgi:HD superfamily phosphohydrolase
VVRLDRAGKNGWGGNGFALFINTYINIQSVSSQLEEKRFLFDIVANKKNSVDVDKFDYIERDTYNLGLRSSYDAKRLLVYSRVVNNEICFHHKEVYNLYEMFHTRYSLFQRIYTHRVSKCVELMLTDALRAAGT